MINHSAIALALALSTAGVCRVNAQESLAASPAESPHVGGDRAGQAQAPVRRELRRKQAPDGPESEGAAAKPAHPPAERSTADKPQPQASEPAQVQPAANQTNLRFEGSNTVGEKLAPTLVQAWASKLGYTAIKTIGSVKPEESEVVAEAAERGDSLHATIHAHGTGTGLEPLAAGKADIWMASRQATLAEAAKAEKAGLGRMLEATNEHTVALDGVLVVVHPDNPIKKLSIEQLGGIFSGKFARWSDVGGRDAPIAIYSRDAKSGTFDTFKTLVLRGKTMAGTAKLFEASEELSDEVASDPNGIGFIGIAYGRSAKPLSVATSCGLSIAPSAFSIKTGEYPLARRLYMYTKEKPAPDPAKFLEFAQSLEAQDVVARAGFIDFRPAVADKRYTGDRLDAASNARDGGQASIRESDVSQMEDATSGAVRLAVTFRFIAGSDRLDSLARADIDRLKEVLKTPSLAGAKVVLIGFTQSLGDYQSNRIISRRRAAAVKAELESRGVPVETAVGVGPAAPVACNTDDAARALNQRVEVWLRMPPAP